MLDIRYMRKNSAEVKQRLEDRGVNPETIDELLELDQKRRDLIQKLSLLKHNVMMYQIKLLLLSVKKKMLVKQFCK